MARLGVGSVTRPWTFKSGPVADGFAADSHTQFTLVCGEPGCRLAFTWILDAEVLAHCPGMPQDIAAKMMAEHRAPHA